MAVQREALTSVPQALLQLSSLGFLRTLKALLVLSRRKRTMCLDLRQPSTSATSANYTTKLLKLRCLTLYKSVHPVLMILLLTSEQVNSSSTLMLLTQKFKGKVCQAKVLRDSLTRPPEIMHLFHLGNNR